MNIKYSIENLGSKGYGLIAQQFVKAGDVVYNLADDVQAIAVDDKDLEEYLKSVKNPSAILSRGYCTVPKFIDLQHSEAGYVNHSPSPNCVYVTAEKSVALHDIQLGDEITENYAHHKIGDNYARLMVEYVGGSLEARFKDWHYR